MKVKIKILDEKAVMPFKTHEGDFCYDCVAVSEEEIAPNVWKYGLGIALQIDRNPESPFCLADSKDILDEGMTVERFWQLSIDARPPLFCMENRNDIIKLCRYDRRAIYRRDFSRVLPRYAEYAEV